MGEREGYGGGTGGGGGYAVNRRSLGLWRVVGVHGIMDRVIACLVCIHGRVHGSDLYSYMVGSGG